MNNPPNETATFDSLAIGEVFQIAPEHRKAHKLPLFTYRKVDDDFAVIDGHTRGIFRPTTPVVRMAS